MIMGEKMELYRELRDSEVGFWKTLWQIPFLLIFGSYPVNWKFELKWRLSKNFRNGMSSWVDKF